MMRLTTIAPSASTSTTSTSTARLVPSSTRSSTIAARASATSSHSSLPSPFATSWSSLSSPFSSPSSSSTSSTTSFSTSPPLSPEDTAAAARLARVAGLAYSSRSELPVLLRETEHELVEDLGETFFTRAFVADDGRTRGRVIALRGLAWAGTERADPIRLGAALAKVWPVEISASDSTLTSAAAAATKTTAATATTAAMTTLHAHAGVAELGRETARLVRRLVRETPPTTPITFVGHSLGGALALATAVLLAAEGEVGCRTKKGNSIESCRRPVRVVTFGAPPSFAPASGDGDLNATLAQVFGPGFPLSPLPSSSSPSSSPPPSSAVTSFFAEGDPVPRWLLSSDPTFSAAVASFPPLSLALQARSWLFGRSAPLSSTRFLFEAAGDCYLISWTSSNGHAVVPLPRGGSAVSEALGEAALEDRTPAAVAAAAAKDAVDRVSSAATAAAGRGSIDSTAGNASSGSNIRRAIGFLLDHAHASYADDLKAAATQAKRKREKNEKSGKKKRARNEKTCTKTDI